MTFVPVVSTVAEIPAICIVFSIWVWLVEESSNGYFSCDLPKAGRIEDSGKAGSPYLKELGLYKLTGHELRPDTDVSDR